MSNSSLLPPLWFQNALETPEVTDVCLNGTQTAYWDRGEGMTPIPESLQSPWTAEVLRAWVIEKLSAAGKSWDAQNPFMDAHLPNHRLHVIFPPLSQNGLLVSLRRVSQSQKLLGALPEDRWTSCRERYRFLAQCVRRRESLLLSGATGSGKTTLLNDLLSEIPSQERVLALEDTPELRPGHPHFLSLVSRAPNSDGRGEVSLRTLLKQCLRMRPDRIVLGECRGAEVLDLLQCLNTGHGGALATLHANSPRDALRRVELLCLLTAGAGGTSGLTPGVIRELLVAGIRWVAQVERVGAERKITKIQRIEGIEGGVILMRPVDEIPSAVI